MSTAAAIQYAHLVPLSVRQKLDELVESLDSMCLGCTRAAQPSCGSASVSKLPTGIHVDSSNSEWTDNTCAIVLSLLERQRRESGRGHSSRRLGCDST